MIILSPSIPAEPENILILEEGTTGGPGNLIQEVGTPGGGGDLLQEPGTS